MKTPLRVNQPGNLSKHNQNLIDQYNRNRLYKDHVKDMAELNRKLLDKEIKEIGK